MSKVKIKRGPMTIGPVSIGSMEITMDSSEVEALASHGIHLGPSVPEQYGLDLESLLATSATLVDAAGVRLMDECGPKMRLADHLPDVRRLRKSIEEVFLPALDMTLSQVLTAVSSYIAQSGQEAANPPIATVLTELEGIGMYIGLAMGPGNSLPRAYAYVRDPDLFLDSYPQYSSSEHLLKPEAYFWVG